MGKLLEVYHKISYLSKNRKNASPHYVFELGTIEFTLVKRFFGQNKCGFRFSRLTVKFLQAYPKGGNRNGTNWTIEVRFRKMTYNNILSNKSGKWKMNNEHQER